MPEDVTREFLPGGWPSSISGSSWLPRTFTSANSGGNEEAVERDEQKDGTDIQPR